MYKKGQIIAVDGQLYEYDREFNGFHIAYEVMIDEDGKLTATNQPHGLSDRILKDDPVNFTNRQWYGIVEHFIRQDYYITEEEITEVTEDIVGRCFAYGIPKIHELADYIADYMNR